jgi:Holliday junction resolvasome RuvABC endonuclease subunit
MICIGLDLATKRTGCCILNDGNLVHYECITSSEPDFRDRIRIISKKIEEVIINFSPDEMFIEDAPIIHNSSASMLLIMHGYVLSIANRYNIPVEIFEPTSWRKTVGIVGKNGKEALKKEFVKQATVDYVNARFGLNLIYIPNEKKNDPPSQDDIADSIGIACCGIARKQNNG